MLAFFELLLFGVVAAVLIAVSKNGGKRDAASSDPRNGTMRCPNCGSPANVRNGRWECPYCGDSGGG